VAEVGGARGAAGGGDGGVWGGGGGAWFTTTRGGGPSGFFSDFSDVGPTASRWLSSTTMLCECSNVRSWDVAECRGLGGLLAARSASILCRKTDAAPLARKSKTEPRGEAEDNGEAKPVWSNGEGSVEMRVVESSSARGGGRVWGRGTGVDSFAKGDVGAEELSDSCDW